MSPWERAFNRMNKVIRDKFPSDAVFTPLGGVAEPHVCVHDQGYMEILNGQGEVAQSGIFHTAFVVLADLSRQPKTTDGYSIGGVNFELVDIQPDGTGGLKLVLLLAGS